MILLLLLFIPLLIALFNYVVFNKKISVKEFWLHILCQFVIASLSVSLIYFSNTYDVEIWNGSVIDKKFERVSCRHSYQCNCVEHCSTDSEGDEDCYEICQTCYEHDYDIDWKVYSNIRTWNIDTVDRQGLEEPPRWSEVKIGDPVSIRKTYINYIKASPNTLFKQQGLVDKYKSELPDYPSNIYDYYKINRIVDLAGQIKDIQLWEKDLFILNSVLGYQKQVNIVIVFLREKPREFISALEQYWLGGKKNDVVLVINLVNEEINWVDVLAWTDNEIFKIELRDAILDLKTLEKNKVLITLSEQINKNYVRKPMKDFEYLKSSITPTTAQWIIFSLFGLISSIVLSIYFYQNEI